MFYSEQANYFPVILKKGLKTETKPHQISFLSKNNKQKPKQNWKNSLFNSYHEVSYQDFISDV